MKRTNITPAAVASAAEQVRQLSAESATLKAAIAAQQPATAYQPVPDQQHVDYWPHGKPTAEQQAMHEAGVSDGKRFADQQRRARGLPPRD